jgi:hypothetical protein
MHLLLFLFTIFFGNVFVSSLSFPLSLFLFLLRAITSVVCHAKCLGSMGLSFIP